MRSIHTVKHPGRKENLFTQECQSALNCGIIKVMHSHIDFLCLGKKTAEKTKPIKYVYHAVLQILMATLFLL